MILIGPFQLRIICDSYQTFTSVLTLEWGIKTHEQSQILFYNQMPNFEFSYKIAWLLRVEGYGNIHLRITGDHWHSFYFATTDFAFHWRTENFFLNALVLICLTQVFHNSILLMCACNFSSSLKIFLWQYRWYTTAYRLNHF